MSKTDDPMIHDVDGHPLVVGDTVRLLTSAQSREHPENIGTGVGIVMAKPARSGSDWYGYVRVAWREAKINTHPIYCQDVRWVAGAAVAR